MENRIAALPERAAQARAEAARLLAPQAVRVRPRGATLKTEAEVEAYVAELREDLLRHVTAGKPVVIG